MVQYDTTQPTPTFVGRTLELAHLHSILCVGDDPTTEKPTATTAIYQQYVLISGLGGIGKSDFVRKYVYQHMSSINCAWIRAEKHLNLVDSFQNLATELGIKLTAADGITRKPVQTIVDEVYKYFRAEPSLFVFDNAEAYKKSDDAIFEFLPKSAHPASVLPFILITTRNAELMIGRDVQKFPLGVLTAQESRTFFTQELNLAEHPESGSSKSSEMDDVDELGRKLQHLPLALQQAAAYIVQENLQSQNTDGTKYAVWMYLDLLNDNAKFVVDSGLPPESTNAYEDSTLAAWRLSLNKISQNHKFGRLAIEILKVLSYLSPERIEVKLICDIVMTFVQPEEIEQAEDHSVCTQYRVPIEAKIVKSALQLASNHSMFQMSNGVINIHRLVQEVIRCTQVQEDYAVLRHVLQYFQTRLLSNVTSSLSWPSSRNLENGEVVDLDVDSAVSCWGHAMSITHPNLVADFKSLPQSIATVLQNQTRFDEALTFTMSSITTLSTSMENDQGEAVLALRNKMGVILYLQGKYGPALTTFEQVAKIYSDQFGQKHVKTLDCLHNVALVQNCLGNFQEALTTYQVLCPVSEDLLGKEHESTLKSKHNKAMVLNSMGRLDESLELYMEVSRVRSNTIGIQHPDTMTTNNNLATVLAELQRNDEALQLFYSLLPVTIEIHGPTHPSVFRIQHNIAEILRLVGKTAEALEMYDEVWKGREKALGLEHVDTLTTINNIAIIHATQKNAEEAIKLWEIVARTGAAFLGSAHSLTLMAKGNIANVLRHQKKYTEALVMLEGILQLRQYEFGPQHPSTLITMNNIGMIKMEQGLYQESKKMLEEVLLRRQAILGNEHMETLDTQRSLVNVYIHCKLWKDAQTMCQRVHETFAKLLGKDHLKTMAALEQLKNINVVAIQNNILC